ncbi:hypothetical protein MMC29_005062 [Sticta canariensis]|nr:hypothetical protein [Sticta canariensis]
MFCTKLNKTIPEETVNTVHAIIDEQDLQTDRNTKHFAMGADDVRVILFEKPDKTIGVELDVRLRYMKGQRFKLQTPRDQFPDVFMKYYKAKVSDIDVAAHFFDVGSRTQGRSTIDGMKELWDPELPRYLPSEVQKQFDSNPEVKNLDEEIAELTKTINGASKDHQKEVSRRGFLYKAKRKLKILVHKTVMRTWDRETYDDQVALQLEGNLPKSKAQTKPSAFSLLKQFMPEQGRLASAREEHIPCYSEIGRQILADLVSLCKEEKEAIHLPGEEPAERRCPVCRKQVQVLIRESRAHHIHVCKGKDLKKFGESTKIKGSRWTKDGFAMYSYHCYKWIQSKKDWDKDCQDHLLDVPIRCGPLTYRYTQVLPGYCPFCLGGTKKKASKRLQTWLGKKKLVEHIDKSHLKDIGSDEIIRCPHPKCDIEVSGAENLMHHFYNFHDITKPKNGPPARGWQKAKGKPDRTEDGTQSKNILYW